MDDDGSDLSLFPLHRRCFTGPLHRFASRTWGVQIQAGSAHGSTRRCYFRYRPVPLRFPAFRAGDVENSRRTPTDRCLLPHRIAPILVDRTTPSLGHHCRFADRVLGPHAVCPSAGLWSSGSGYSIASPRQQSRCLAGPQTDDGTLVRRCARSRGTTEHSSGGRNMFARGRGRRVGT